MKRDAVAVLFALTFPSVLTWVYFVVLAGDGAASSPLFQLAYSTGKIVQFGFPLVYIWLTLSEQRLWFRPRWPGVLWGVGFGALAATGILLLYHGWLKGHPWLADTPQRIYEKIAAFDCTTPLRFLLLASFISVVHSLLEEYYWRWFVFGRLRTLVSLPTALVIGSLGFMAHHVIVLAVYFPVELVVPFSLGVAIGGAVWAWLYQRSGSLLGPWLSHLLVDAGIMLVGYDMIVGRM